MTHRIFRRLLSLSIALMMLTLPSCNGLFSGIYDDPPASEAPITGFLTTDSDGLGGTICVDVRSYKHWVYVDLLHHTLTTADIALSEAPPTTWHFALHRWDARMGEGAACETAAEALSSESQWEGIENMPFQGDVDSVVMVDISQMMDSIIGYDTVSVNPVLSQWMNCDMSHMPPTYTPSNRVYLLRFTDGTYAALHFDQYMNSQMEKGVLTLRYRYPLP